MEPLEDRRMLAVFMGHEPEGGSAGPASLEVGMPEYQDVDPTSVEIGGRVWHDLDGDGIQDAGENGIGGVGVRLLNERNMGISTTTTNDEGRYVFANYQAGTYSVEFTSMTHAGYLFTTPDQGASDLTDSDADPSTRRTSPFTLAAGVVDESQDAGLFRSVAVLGIVWSDGHFNGIREPEDEGVPNVEVRLFDASSQLVDSTITLWDGSYAFYGLRPGPYTVQFVAPTDTLFSPKDQADDGQDSDADQASGRTDTFLVASGATTHRDAGIHGRFGTTRVHGFVWNDFDQDGIRDSGETGAGDVTVNLLDDTLAEVASTTTAPNGNYMFPPLSSGWYSIEFVAPDDMTLSPMNRGDDDRIDSDANRASGRTEPFFLIDGQIISPGDAGIGIEPGTARVMASSGPIFNTAPRHLTAVGRTLFFTHQDETHGVELWKSDGTEAGTVIVADIHSGTASSNPENLCDVNGILYFTADDGSTGAELWRSDGTANGTVRVADIYPGPASSNPANLTDMGGTLFFTARNATHGTELWKSNGTEGGTSLVRDIILGGEASHPQQLTVMGGTLFFAADNPAYGLELWKSGGTAETTTLVKDISPGDVGSKLKSLTAVGDTLFFSADDATHGEELWRSDGTTEGTTMVADLRAGIERSLPTQLVDVGGTLFFRARTQPNNATYNELWKSDGTEQGTVPVGDVFWRENGYPACKLTSFNDTLFFTWHEGLSPGLWKSDGTDEGTVLVVNARRYFSNLTPSDNELLFVHRDDDTGMELWKTDGTEEGTVLIKDVNPGPNGSSPGDLTLVDDTLFFTAWDADSHMGGRSLWRSDCVSPTELRNTLRITEIMPDDYPEFIELKNVGPEPLDLTGVRFIDGISFDFTYGDLTSLFPDEHVVLVRNRIDFGNQYDTSEINIAGQYVGLLDDTGERLELVAPVNKTILEFTYDSDWFALTEDERFFSLNVLDETADAAAWAEPSQWRLSSRREGSPGADDPRLTPDPGAVVINEVMSNPADGYNDWIELHNTTDQDIDIGGWWFGDDDGDGDPRFWRYRIEPGTVIAAGGYQVFTRLDHFGFGLSSFGERLQLTAGTPDDDPYGYMLDHMLGYSETVRFGGAATDISFGRFGDEFIALSEPTMGQANAGPAVGPVVINEIMYHPAYLHDEFIELRNTTPEPIDLGGWTLTGVDTYLTPPETVIPPEGFALIVSIEPDDFRAKYAIDAEVPIVGPYEGALDNASDDIELYRLDAFGRRILTDRVEYEDESPWPEEADQGGGSLERANPIAYGNDPASWRVTTEFGGTPGRENSTFESTVVGRHVFYNNSLFDGNDPTANAQDDQAIAVDKQALLPGQTASFENYTNYVRGINGIMVDIFGPTDLAELNPTEDFAFKLSNDQHPDGWSPGPPPTRFMVREDAGVDGADRVMMIWPDGMLKNRWLQVTVKATDNTGLSEDDVFYFGNAPGEAGDNPTNAIVSVTDEVAARNFQHSAVDQALIDDPFDYNRDGLVNGTDQIIARVFRTTPLTMLKLMEAREVDPEQGNGVADDSSPQEPLFAVLDWSDEYDRMQSKQTQRKDVEATVDMLLATEWA